MERPEEQEPEGFQYYEGQLEEVVVPDDEDEEDDYEDDDEEEEEFSEVGNIGAIAGPYGSRSLHSNRMALSDQERNLALNIKEAIRNARHVDPVSDFMCAQLALIDADDTEKAVERVYHLQCFREEYKILDTAVDGKRSFQAYLDLMPGFHLCFSDDLNMGKNVMVFDDTKFRGKHIKTEQHLRYMMGSSYYTMVAFCPDFEAIRNGAIIVAECEGYDWKVDLDFKTLKKLFIEVGCAYPMTFSKAKFFNAGTTFNLFASMMKPIIPKNLRDKLELGCQFEQRLDELYLVPNLETANMRFLARIEDSLYRRYENERTFRL